MNNIFKQIKRTFAVLSALFITVVTSKIRGYQPCGPEELIHCAKPLSMLTDSGLTFASSKQDLDRMCPDLRSAMNCIHRYTRHCMSREEQTHFKTLFRGTGQMVHDLCRNGTYQEEYLKYAPCMKQVEAQNEVCLKTYTVEMKNIESKTTSREEEGTSEEPDSGKYQKRKREAADEGIKNVCCAFQTYVECSTHTMRRSCGEESARFSRDFLDKMSSSLIQLHCREYGPRECGLLSAASPISFSSTLSAILTILTPVLLYSLS